MRMIIDPRCGRKTKHDHAEVLTCLIAGFLAGRNTIRRCLKWCENHIDFLKQHLELENGIASPSTVSRILGNIDEEMFCLVFIEWMAGILRTKGINIAIDGKALRGSMEKIRGKQAPYILNAIDTATALVIAQLPIAEKENEIVTIPKLLELLNIKGSLVTIDAIGTAKSVMDTIRNKEADYLLTVKKGNPLTYQETKRNHWKIENSLYYVLDDLFKEGRSPARKSKNNLAVIRKIVYNLLRIAIIVEKPESGPTEMRDQFSDNLTLMEKYLFRGIPAL